MEIQEIKQKIKEMLPDIQKRFFIVEIGVFGSYATEHQTEASDIDILVTFLDGHNDFFNYSRLKDYLEMSFGKTVDLVPKDAVKTELRDSILKEVTYA